MSPFICQDCRRAIDLASYDIWVPFVSLNIDNQRLFDHRKFVGKENTGTVGETNPEYLCSFFGTCSYDYKQHSEKQCPIEDKSAFLSSFTPNLQVVK